MGAMSPADLIGVAAAILTLVAFAQTRMVPMRVAAIGANACFIAFGLALPCYPVLVLHVVLLPLNLRRLIAILPDTAAACRLEEPTR